MLTADWARRRRGESVPLCGIRHLLATGWERSGLLCTPLLPFVGLLYATGLAQDGRKLHHERILEPGDKDTGIGFQKRSQTGWIGVQELVFILAWALTR